jgi:flavin reductase (DIM6/NTAB) family NADH-FMN oxidoreductase RutF
VAYLECRLTQRIPAGDHEIVVGRPVAGEILRPDAIALSYADTGELDGSRELYPESFD